jgi:hypothetical protein
MRMFVETMHTIIVAKNSGDMNPIALAAKDAGNEPDQ